MAVCAKCGATLGEGIAFCGSCGAPVAGAGGAPAPAASASGMASNVAGLLTYVFGFITGIIFLVIEPYKYDKFVRFHAFQSIFFNVATFVVWIIFSIISSVIAALTLGFGGLIMVPVAGLLGLAMMAYWIFLMYKAYNNERYMIPFIGNLAAKQAG